MRNWEYKVISFTPKIIDADKQIELKLNELGGQGWELVSHNITNGYVNHYVFKRWSVLPK